MNLRNLRERITGTSEADTASDFGLGDKVARSSGTRLINNDGTFNVVRRGHSTFAPYQNLVEMSWWQFLAIMLAAYIFVNVIFTVGFLLIGTDSLSNITQSDPFWYRFLGAFFFSVQTFTTVGYGSLAPIGIAANTLAAFVALFGWIALAVATGLFYARFARPQRLILFSNKAIIAPYQNGLSLQFRIANKRDSNLINLNARVVLTWLEGDRRRFAPLKLERDNVPLFPLNWTIVHPIDKNSPINGWTKQDCCRLRSELLITVDGYDETFAQAVHINNSYIYDEIEWNVRFEPMYFEEENTTELHLDRIHNFVALEEE
jgi:inward rectifier potassium channel